jgi:SAM-dependent methyltransferase
MLKAKLKQIIPPSLMYPLWARYCRWQARAAEQAFVHATAEPNYLDWDTLRQLDAAYPSRPDSYVYDDPHVLVERAQKQIALMLHYVPRSEQLHRFLDLGSWDGTCSRLLHDMGKFSVGVDIRTEGYTAEACQSGASFIQLDADTLSLADNSFDFVFSFNSFEHFPHPDTALREAIRVTRPNGYLYLDFGPLWWAPKGAHQFEHVGIPFSQCLFTRDMLHQLAAETGRTLTDYNWMNEWSIAQYRQLWVDIQDEVEIIFKYEEYTAEGMELITQYPSCFKSKSTLFDDFQVSYIHSLLRKK